ncbi:MFS transporter [Streptomyces sp. NPDC026672]|uniref:CynX/NimT family MFS transporter n=1 Tax=unclassified Streptomyces TaxID=2593676 RepID=UPI0033CD8F8F
MTPPPDTLDLRPAQTPAKRGGSHRKPRRRSFAATLLGAGLIAIALNLRIGVASVSPVLSDIRADLGLSTTVASLLTTVPVVAFGAFAFLTPGLTRRLGMHRLLGVVMVAMTAGLLLRLEPSLSALLGGTVVVGAAIAVANAVMPAAIKHDFAHRTSLMMGLYSTALFLGAALASGLTVPLVSSLGGHWRPALGIWAIPAVIALMLWLPQLRRGRTTSGKTGQSDDDAFSELGEPPFRAILRDPTAIAVTALMGIQSMSYYAVLTWAPTLLQDHGMSAGRAGAMLSFSSFPGILASLVTPALAQKLRPTWLPVALSVVLTAVAYLGLGIAPIGGALLWMTLLGLGQGAAISLSLTYIVWRSPDTHHTGHVSTMAQGFGYLFAGLGPVGLGALHTATGGWTVPLIGLAVLLVFQMISGGLAGRDRHVRARVAGGGGPQTAVRNQP